MNQPTKAQLNFFAMFLGATLLALPDVVNAQLTFVTNSGAITITGYNGIAAGAN